MRYMMGIDVGGTFTDFTLTDVETQSVYSYKVRSTPADPSLAIMQGIDEFLSARGVAHEQIAYLAHGSTVATNAVLEHKGAMTGLITTGGFRDLLEIGNQKRPSLYDLRKEKPVPLVPARLRLDVPERLYHDGTVHIPLDQEALRQAVGKLRSAGVQSIAICFLFSFVNPAHEMAAAALVREMFPEAYLSVSHEVVPEFREFPRLSTTVLNAYVGPIMERYLSNLEKAIRERDIRATPYITQSNGGTISLAEAIHSPIRTAVSGPSAGVIAGVHLARATGLPNLITFDMGGTSADISLLKDGEPVISVAREIEGWPASIPMLDIITIGAGGGSIARVDVGGALKVGPESAGAMPGPACYATGGTEPTVTDANVVLGFINPSNILGGRMVLDCKAAERAIEEVICQPTGLSVRKAAEGIIDVVNANMVRAIRVVSVERGYDVREFALAAFGGAGPLHAVALAQELKIPRVVVPPSPGTFCALGQVLTDVRTDLVRSYGQVPSLETLGEMKVLFDELTREGQAFLVREQIAPAQQRYVRWVEARYTRQNYELLVPMEEGDLNPEGLQHLIERFHAEHARVYGYARRERAVEFMNLRLTAIGELPKAPTPLLAPRDGEGPVARQMRYLAFKEFRDEVLCPIYWRDDLCAGDALAGPFVVEQMDATTVVPPGLSCTVDRYGNILIDVTER